MTRPVLSVLLGTKPCRDTVLFPGERTISEEIFFGTGRFRMLFLFFHVPRDFDSRYELKEFLLITCRKPNYSFHVPSAVIL